jgi:hypothetical protein
MLFDVPFNEWPEDDTEVDERCLDDPLPVPPDVDFFDCDDSPALLGAA